MTESKTLLVSGGAGYVGSALVSRILRDTNWNVKVFDDLMYGGNSLFQFYNFDRFSFIKGDLRDLKTVELVIDETIDEVYQLAADMGGAGFIFTGDNDADIMYNSAQINIHVLELCRKQNVKKK